MIEVAYQIMNGLLYLLILEDDMEAKIAYICDKTKCISCETRGVECSHTFDYNFAKNKEVGPIVLDFMSSLNKVLEYFDIDFSNNSVMYITERE